MNDICILITGVGAIVANSVINNFKNITERKIKIIGCDIKDYVSSIDLLNSYYKIPKYSDTNYIEELLKIAEAEKVDIIVPLIDFEIIQINKHIEKFNKFKLLMINTPEINQVLDKANLFNFLKNNHVAVPNYFIAENYKEFKIACKKLDYKNQPICFKPAISSGSRGFRIIDNSIPEYDLLQEKPNSAYTNYKKTYDILKKQKYFPKLLVMEYLPEEAYVIHVLAKKGTIVYQIICKVINEVSSNLIEGEIIYNEEIKSYCKNVVDILKIDGIFGIELKRDKNGTLKMLEINPRIQGSINICNSIGINLPYFAIKQLYNEELPKVNTTKKLRIIRSYQETFIDLSK